jgi:DeoR family transcriptional regulator of aga operon
LGHLLSTERQQRIVHYVEDKRQATVAELSKLFDVSETTIRRDLSTLESQGRVLRAHGGAVAVEHRTPEAPVIRRASRCAEEKRRIARTAADLVQDGDTIFLGLGTTALEVARALADRSNLTVITNALHIVYTLAGQSGITVIVLGGLLRHSELSTTGYLAQRTLEDLRADKVIIGVTALSLKDGLTGNYLPEVNTVRAIMSLSREVIVVADHTKFGQVSTVSIAPISAVNTIITDDGAPPDQVEALRRAGVKVIIAA